MLRSKANNAPNRFQELLSDGKITPSISRTEIRDFFAKDDDPVASKSNDTDDSWIRKYTDDALVAMKDKGTLQIYRAELQIQLDRVDAVMASAAPVANDEDELKAA